MEKITRELNQSNSDKDLFLSILAHDLKSPFNAILGFLNLLTHNIRKYDIDTIENQVNFINKSAQNTFNLLEELLIWTSSQTGKLSFKPQKLNFFNICQETLSEIKPMAEAKKIAIVQTGAKKISVFADIEMLKAILRNLVSNAIKFCNPNGSVVIKAEQNNNDIIISITDSGIGISPEVVKILFDITHKHSTKGTANETGTGLGLILCKEFVEKHKGNIWVESEFGKGSKFVFTLPLTGH